MNPRVTPSNTAYMGTLPIQSHTPEGKPANGIRLITSARAAVGFPAKVSTLPEHSGTRSGQMTASSNLLQAIPVPPVWAETVISATTMEAIETTARLLRQHQWTETRFSHPITFGFTRVPDTQRPLFTASLTEIAVLNQSLVLTTTDLRSGLAVESITIDHDHLRQLLADHSEGTTVYLGNPPEHVKALYELGVPCPSRTLPADDYLGYPEHPEQPFSTPEGVNA